MSDFAIDTLYPKVLSVQSSVVFGYVGNKASVYGLHARRIEVDPLNTCQFSNHTGYDTWSGPKTTGAELRSIVDGMNNNQLLPQYTHILSGYIASQCFIEELPNTIQSIKDQRAEYCNNKSIIHEDNRVIYLCDPVLGDNGSMYVPSAFLDVYKNKLVPLSDIVTPNETELALLIHKTKDYVNIDDRDDEFKNNNTTKEDEIQKFKSLNEVQQACITLHKQGPKLVVVTSMDHYHVDNNTENQAQVDMAYDITIPPDEDKNCILKCLGLNSIKYNINDLPQCIIDDVNDKLKPISTIGCLISYFNEKLQQYQQYYIKIPRFDGYIVGTGDLTASLILSHLQQYQYNTEQQDPVQIGEDISRAIANAIATIHGVIRHTLIRSFVGKHCTSCESCLSKQNVNKKNMKDSTLLAKLEANEKTNDNIHYKANLVTEPLELWLPGCYGEFTKPTTIVTPQKLSTPSSL